MLTTTWDEQGARRILERLLQKRFGPLSTEVHERLAALSAERLEQLAVAILEAKSLKDLGLED